LKDKNYKIFVLDEKYSNGFNQNPLNEFECRIRAAGDGYLMYKIILTKCEKISKKTYETIVKFYGIDCQIDEIYNVLDNKRPAFEN